MEDRAIAGWHRYCGGGTPTVGWSLARGDRPAENCGRPRAVTARRVCGAVELRFHASGWVRVSD